MNQQQDRNAGRLDERVRGLAREISPNRDLWPGIAFRLNQKGGTARGYDVKHRGLGNWLSIPVAMAAGYLLAAWFPLPWSPGQLEQDSRSGQPQTELLASVQPALEQLPAKTRAVVEADLTGFERDRITIEQALAGDPDNPLLLELLMSVEDRALSVREQMNRLTSMETEAAEI